MLQSLSSVNHDLVSIQDRPIRRLRLRGPTAVLLTMAAVLASGVAAGQLAPSHSRTAYHAASQPQPFDHFPR